MPAQPSTDLHAPLPSGPGPAAADRGAVPFDRADPRWNEPLVDLAATGLLTEAFYARRDGGNAPYGAPIAGAVEVVAVRRGLAERLLRADARLRPHGVRLKVLDGFRPVEAQAGLWRHFEEDARARHPHWSAAEIEAHVLTFCSDPRRFDPADETSWPLHSTGGSVDVLLADAGSGAELDHGAGFDEASERSFTDHYEAELAAGGIRADDPRLLARRLLVNAMVNAGFTNYHYEFWHFDYGTQLHAATARHLGWPDAPGAAWYGTTTLEQHGLAAHNRAPHP